jgi:hypothetical protein
MYPSADSESEMQKIGGDPLNGSGFESETAESEFQSDAHSAEEGLLR